MSTLDVILGIILLLAAIFLVAAVLMQQGKSKGMGAIGGGSDSYTFQAKSKTWDAKFARWTKWVALAFVLLTFVLVLL